MSHLSSMFDVAKGKYCCTHADIDAERTTFGNCSVNWHRLHACLCLFKQKRMPKET